MMGRPVRFGTFLAPNMYSVYQAIVASIGRQLGCATELVVGSSFEQFEAGALDAGFICGLPYVELARRNPSPVELLAAPVLVGERYGGRPIYFSDVIVRRERSFRSFTDLRGCSWAYNDAWSQSGYNVVRYRLKEMGVTGEYFSRVIETGWHQESIRQVCAGRIDASAIDSQVLAVELRNHPELAAQIRIIDTLGPSTIQPVVAGRHLAVDLKAGIRSALLQIGNDPATRTELAAGFIDCFVAIANSSYDDIRAMWLATEETGLLAPSE
jgi:phosphonate transport system substrate-binding protein